MQLKSLTDKDKIESFLRKDTFLHIYSIGDLDGRFWSFTKWWGLVDDCETIQAIALLYEETVPSTLLLFHDDSDLLGQLTKSIAPQLPNELYLHASPGIHEYLTVDFNIMSCERHIKMSLTDENSLLRVDVQNTRQLQMNDMAEIQNLYKISYPDNWFNPRMLETGQYVGLYIDGKLVCIAGIHVYSPQYRVSALGNITTHPDYRGRGLAQKTTSELCRQLFRNVDHIGLNVHVDNSAGIRCYEKIGFRWYADYEEIMLVKKSVSSGVLA